MFNRRTIMLFVLAVLVVSLVVGFTNKDLFIVDDVSALSYSKEWTENANNPLIAFGDVIPNYFWNDPSVIFEDGEYRMWLSGGNPKVSPIRVEIYEARSSDGLNWNVNPAPVLEPSSNGWDSLRIETPSVVKVGETYHMYYSGCSEGNCEAGQFDIGHATSSDGTNWVKDSNNPVIVDQAVNGSQWGIVTVAEPGAVYNERDGKIYLYYMSAVWDYDLNKPWYGILLSTSPGSDGSSFTHLLDNNGGRDAVLTLSSHYNNSIYSGYSTPFVYLDSKGRFHMYYSVIDTSSEFRQVAISYAFSRNGKKFRELDRDVLTAGNKDWKDHEIRAPAILRTDGKLLMWFAGNTRFKGNWEDFVGGIGFASRQD